MCLPEKGNGSAMADEQEHHHAAAVPEDGWCHGQMQGLAWLLRVLDRPENQWSVEALWIDTSIGEPALTMALPAGGQ